MVDVDTADLSYQFPVNGAAATVIGSQNDVIRICHPDTWRGEGTDVPPTKIGGFRIKFEDLGELRAVEGNNRCVDYWIKYVGRQIIEFLADYPAGARSYAVVDGIIVHDHASIPQGGPAYATYFSGQGISDEEGS